jgi:hypothetical protein
VSDHKEARRDKPLPRLHGCRFLKRFGDYLIYEFCGSPFAILDRSTACAPSLGRIDAPVAGS